MVRGNFGPANLLVSAAGAALSTARNVPEEYGPHWDGFGKRLRINAVNSAVSNTMEASLGAVWGEDPRYIRDAEGPFKSRLGHAVRMTFMARNRDGQLHPAYARFIAIPSTNFLSNTWRVDSDATAQRALSRTAFGFLGRLTGNVFKEFWPDVSRKMHGNKSQSPPSFVP